MIKFKGQDAIPRDPITGKDAWEAVMRFSERSIRLMACALIGAGVLFSWTSPVAAQCYDLTLPGPVLTDDTVGHTNTGLSLIPNADISLTSFTFNNQGLADTVYLVRVSDGAVLYSKATPAGSPTHTVNVDWDLLKGETYRLLATTSSNGRWRAFSSYPYSNSNLMVEGTWTTSLQTSYWFHFTGLRTDCSVCTPSVVPGPTLTEPIVGWADSGLSLTATANTRLRSFRFLNQGAHDTIQLIRESDGAVLHRATTPEGESDYVVVVDWGLLAGETYRLISVEESNGRYVNYTAWPVVNGDLVINQSWGLGGGMDDLYWFKFTDLKTRCGPCPFDTVNGMSLPGTVTGWEESGISITADVDTILRRFTFNNLGLADTVQLLRESDSAIVGSVATPAGETTYEAVVNWQMYAGVTYHLISAGGANGRYADFSSWPVSNSMVTLNGTWGAGALQPSWWFKFTGLLTTSDCSIFECDLETNDLFEWAATPGADCGGWEWNGACWYTSNSENMSCNQVCSEHGGFDIAGSIHTGNRVGIHYWPEKLFETTNWEEIECSSTDNNKNWGANGGTPDGDWFHPSCYVNCACNN